MDEKRKLDSILKSQKSIIMLAPSFPLNFRYPNIIGMLRAVGFEMVTEVTFGARMINYYYTEYIKEHFDQKYFIASPCPTIVAYIENKFPELVRYLIPIVSPMAAMAKIYRFHHSSHKIVFLSPCFAKKMIEAPRYPDCLDLVLTFQDLERIFEEKGIFEENYNRDYYFDSLIREYTKVYPVSGGLASTSHIGKLFKKSEVFIDEGIDNTRPVLEGMRSGTCRYRFLDILNCSGGCIGGPTINEKLPLEEKRITIANYHRKSSERRMGEHEGKIEAAAGIDLRANY